MFGWPSCSVHWAFFSLTPNPWPLFLFMVSLWRLCRSHWMILSMKTLSPSPRNWWLSTNSTQTSPSQPSAMFFLCSWQPRLSFAKNRHSEIPIKTTNTKAQVMKLPPFASWKQASRALITHHLMKTPLPMCRSAAKELPMLFMRQRTT